MLTDRAFPCLCKSLRNQKVTYLACGEDHTAALTLDGGLFTYGAGTYGQLGHRSKTHEILPKKVTELMGSNVTQIACGRYVILLSSLNDVFSILLNICVSMLAYS